MFISEDEARRRLEDSRNIFSPSYVPEAEDKDGSHTEENREEDSPIESHVDAPQVMSPTAIDRLLSGAVDPRRVRNNPKSLHGEVDTQVAIGVTSTLLGPKAASGLFGIGEKQTQAYQKGLSTPNDMRTMRDRVPARTAKLKSVKERLAEKASSRLSSALNSLTDEKIDGCSAVKISAIAKDMAVVMDKVTKDNSKTEAIHFHVFRPEMKTVEQYTTVQVSAPLIINNDGGAGS